MPSNILYIVLCCSQPIKKQCCGWTSLCDSPCNYKMPFSSNYQETEKNKGFFLAGPGNYTAYLGPHSEVLDRERAVASAHSYSFWFL